MKCFFYKYEGEYGYTVGCGNSAHVEILEDNFIADEHGTRVTGSYWKPLCWNCMVYTIANPDAIKEDGIRTVPREPSEAQIAFVEAGQRGVNGWTQFRPYG